MTTLNNRAPEASTETVSREAAIVEWALFGAACAPMFAIAGIKWEGLVLKISLGVLFLVALIPFGAIMT